jgi:dolichol-phosphate mannosyltransferase
MDADLSHQPEQIPKLLEVADIKSLVIGTRWINGGSVVNWSYSRRFLSRLATGDASRMLALEYKDLTSGYRESITSRGCGFQIEIALQIINLGFQIKEVTITFIERIGGKSKMSLFIVFEAWMMVTARGFKRIVGSR